MGKEKDDSDLEYTVKGDAFNNLPPGVYTGIYTRHEKRFFRGGSKLYVWFKIIDSGQYFALEVFRPYNHYEPLPRGSKLYKDFVLLSRGRKLKGERLSLKLFKNKELKLKLRTVEKDLQQAEHLPENLYSVVDQILGVVQIGKDVRG